MNFRSFFMGLLSALLLCLSACGGSDCSSRRASIPSTPLPASQARYVKVGYEDVGSGTVHMAEVALEKDGDRYRAATSFYLPPVLTSNLYVEVGLPKGEASEDVRAYYPSIAVPDWSEDTLLFRNAWLNVDSYQVVYSVEIINPFAGIPGSRTKGMLRVHFDSEATGPDGGLIEIPFQKFPQI